MGLVGDFLLGGWAGAVAASSSPSRLHRPRHWSKLPTIVLPLSGDIGGVSLLNGVVTFRWDKRWMVTACVPAVTPCSRAWLPFRGMLPSPGSSQPWSGLTGQTVDPARMVAVRSL